MSSTIIFMFLAMLCSFVIVRISSSKGKTRDTYFPKRLYVNKYTLIAAAIERVKFDQLDVFISNCSKTFKKSQHDLNLEDIEASLLILSNNLLNDKTRKAFWHFGIKWNYIRPVGAFVGELVRQKTNGQWKRGENRLAWEKKPPVVCMGANGNNIFRPFELIRLSILSGKEDYLLAGVHSALQRFGLSGLDPEKLGDKKEVIEVAERFRCELLEYKKGTCELIVEAGDSDPEPVTKLSGTPWWPHDTPRPKCEHGHDMAFMMQVLLSDVPGLEDSEDKLLSFHYCEECTMNGMMSFGCGYDEKGYDVSVLSNISKRQSDSLGIITESPITPYRVSLRHVNEVPGWGDEDDCCSEKPLDYPGGENDFDENIYPGLVHVGKSKIGGWPTWAQDKEWPPPVEDKRVIFVCQLDWALCDRASWASGGYAYLFIKQRLDKSWTGELVIQVT